MSQPHIRWDHLTCGFSGTVTNQLFHSLTFTSKSSSSKSHIASHLASPQNCLSQWTLVLPRQGHKLPGNSYVTHRVISVYPSHAWKLSPTVLSYGMATYFPQTAWSLLLWKQHMSPSRLLDPVNIFHGWSLEILCHSDAFLLTFTLRTFGRGYD